MEAAAPDGPLHVVCNAVKISVHNGLRWSLSSSRRKLTRAWMPLANIFEDSTGSVAWLPAHCSKSAIGVRELSNGRKFDSVDHATNDLVDTWAKNEAKTSAPSHCEFKVVEDATDLVECLARWIGPSTREANPFNAPEHFERVKFIRDTIARSSKTAKAKRDFVKKVVAAVKRKAPSSSGITFVAAIPSIGGQILADLFPCA